MKYSCRIEEKDDYLHVISEGEETLRNVMATWKKIARVCNEQGYRKVLSEARMRGKVKLIDIYAFGTLFKETGVPLGLKIAVVCPEERVNDCRFAETVIYNRGLAKARVFTDLDEARAWITRKDGVKTV